MSRSPPAPKPGRVAVHEPALDLERYVPALLNFVSNKMSRSGSALYRREFGVGITEWRIMSLLAIESSIPAARICAVIGFDKGPVSRSLAILEGKGLVAGSADPANARRRPVQLTRAGRTLHDRIIVVALERERRLLSCLTEAQRATLIDVLNLLHGNLGILNDPPTPAPRRGP